MANGKNTGAFIILTILALGGLGLSGYMFIKDQFLEQDTLQLLAVWDELYGSGDDFNISFADNQLDQSAYFSMDTSNETITLNHEGWYRFTFNTWWGSLTSGDMYDLGVYKNGVAIGHPAFVAQAPDSNYAVDFVYYVYSDGDDSFHFRCYSAFNDPFSMAVSQDYNQVALEFVD